MLWLKPTVGWERCGTVPGHDLLGLRNDGCLPLGGNDSENILVDSSERLVCNKGGLYALGRHVGSDQGRADHADPYPCQPGP